MDISVWCRKLLNFFSNLFSPVCTFLLEPAVRFELTMGLLHWITIPVRSTATGTPAYTKLLKKSALLYQLSYEAEIEHDIGDLRSRYRSQAKFCGFD